MIVGSIAFALLLAGDFRLLQAEYGADGRWRDVGATVRKLVRGQGVAFRVDAATLSDPMPGVEKTLRVRYIWQGKTRTAHYPDLAFARLGSPSHLGRVMPGLRITDARYGAGKRTLDATAMLNRMVLEGKAGVNVNNDAMGADPAPSEAKYLAVVYDQHGIKTKVIAAENQILWFPVEQRVEAAKDGELKILEAWFGARGRENLVTSLIEAKRVKAGLRIVADVETMGGDPFPGQSKKLRLRYLYRGDLRVQVVNEGEVLKIPESTGVAESTFLNRNRYN